MERSPPRGLPRKNEEYIGNIQSIENIQRQISTDSYGKKEQPRHVSKKPSGNENIFDLVNKRSNSQNSFRGIELKRNQKQLEQIEEDAPPVIQMDAGPAVRRAPEPVKRQPPPPAQEQKPVMLSRNAKNSQVNSQVNLRKQAVPRATEQHKINARNERNAIKDNMMKVILDNSQA